MESYARIGERGLKKSYVPLHVEEGKGAKISKIILTCNPNPISKTIYLKQHKITTNFYYLKNIKL